MKIRKTISLLLTAVLLLSTLAFGASAMPRPEGFDAFALLHIPQNLHIHIDEIDMSEGFVYGTATWDDDELVSECEFYPMLQIGRMLFRPKSNPFTIIKRMLESMKMAPQKVKEIDSIYDVQNGVCTKAFVIKLLGDNEEIETWNNGMDEANGVKIGSVLRFSMTAVVEFEGYYGETPESDPVTFTLTQDAVGKTFVPEGAADQAAFDAYKAEKAAALDALAQDGDSDASKQLIADAKAEILAVEYDANKSLDDNKAAVDAKAAAVTDKLNADLAAQRKADDPNACKWCGEVHEGFLGKITGFFHSILYFFAHLFGKK